MKSAHRISNLPDKPIVLFDGDCRFCRLWIARWNQLTGDRVEYLPLQDPMVAQKFAELPREQLEEAIHLIATDGTVYSGAEAVFQGLAANPTKQWPLRIYQQFPFLARTTESAYAFIAARRQFFSWITRTLWGQHVERSPGLLTRWIFLRGFGVIYLIAFVSLWVQVEGLIGKRGILPISNLMSQARQAVGARGIGFDRYRLLPTTCWFWDSDNALKFQCGFGALLALALIFGIAPRICLAGVWLLYLSLATAGQEFLGFQWDNLLLEAGLLAIFFAPSQILPRPSREKPPASAALWLLRFLLFKLMFLSGVVKLASGDPLWRNLTAVARHYETQPLPNVLAWHAFQMPLWFHKASCAMMFGIEFAAPFLLFAPRRPRLVGAILIALLQVGIFLTGNYTFFNWLTILLCVVAIDDFTWAAILPKKLSRLLHGQTRARSWTDLPLKLIALLIGTISATQILAPFGVSLQPVIAVERWIAPLRSINSYGLFAVMTPNRPEIIVEGSTDGQNWIEYSFRHKPVGLNRPPTFVAPHQPRLDWQMWFAALGDVRGNPWFVNFCARLLEGSPEVLALLEKNPFPASPPKYIRARLYDYRFTTSQERTQTANWWKRELKGEYLPPISLEMLNRAPAQ